MPKARAAALKALEIDDHLAEAYASLAFVKYVFEWQWKEARDYFKKAIELNPRYAPVRHVYAVYLATVLRQFDQALAQVNKGLELDPLSLPINHMVGHLLLLARRPDAAIATHVTHWHTTIWAMPLSTNRCIRRPSKSSCKETHLATQARRTLQH